MSSILMTVPMETRLQFIREATDFWPQERQDMVVLMANGMSAYMASKTVRRRNPDDMRTIESFYYQARRAEDAFRSWLGKGSDLDILREEGVVRGLTGSRASKLVEEARLEGIESVVEVSVVRLE